MNVTAQEPPKEGPERPVHLTSDYVEMMYLATMLAIGLPLNVYVCVKLFKSRLAAARTAASHQAKNESVRNGFLLMKINLNLCDLLFLCVICVGKLAWLAAYEWKAGVLACKLYQFLSMTTMYISSNVIVCIALDRLRNVLGASTIRQNVAESVRNMLIVAWSLSIIWSLPQLYVWTVANVYPELPGGFYQCSDMWSLAQRFNRTIRYQQFGSTYNVMHVLLVFWIPLLVLIVAYLAIATRLLQYSLKPASSIPNKGVHELVNEIPLQQQPAVVTAVALMNATQRTNTRNNALNLASTPESHLVNDESYDAVCVMEQNEEPALARVLPTSAVDQTASPSLPDQIRTLVDIKGDCRAVEDTGATTRSGRRKRLRYANSQPSLRDARTTSKRQRMIRTLSNLASVRHKTDWSRTSGRVRPVVPAWRRQLRSRVFKTTVLVVLTHVLFWLPYNIFVISKFISPDFHSSLNSHANILKDLQILLTLVNPFLYGFSS